MAFALTIAHADKPRLEFHSIGERVAQFHDGLPAITCALLFIDKARVFPDTPFVVGYDTAARPIDPRFYGDSQARMQDALAEPRSPGVPFPVAGRLTPAGFQTLDQLPMPAGVRDQFTGIPASRFRADISSTALHKTALHDADRYDITNKVFKIKLLRCVTEAVAAHHPCQGKPAVSNNP